MNLPIGSSTDESISLSRVIQPQEKPGAPPNERSSIPELIEFWRYKHADHLPAALQERLLFACEAEPDSAADIAPMTPQTPEAFKRLYVVWGHMTGEGEDSPRGRLQRYLSEHSGYFREELIQKAKAAGEDDAEGLVTGEEAMQALARLDYSTAAPILASKVKSGSPRTSAVALSLDLAHVAAGGERAAPALLSELKQIAEDPKAPAKARDVAITAVMAASLQEQEGWFLGLFRDETLAFSVDHAEGFSPLQWVVEENPDFWIPKVSPLVRSADWRVRQNAVCVLVGFQQERSRADAMLPLLPWLTNPKWIEAPDSSHDRRNLIYSLSRVRMPEAYDGLLYLLGHPEESGMFELESAVEAITLIHDVRAVTALKKLLVQPQNVRDQKAIVEALLSMNAFTLNDKVDGIMSFARSQKHPRGDLPALDQDQIVDANVVLGGLILQTEGDQPALLQALAKRKAQLQGDQNDHAHDIQLLKEVLDALPDASRDRALLNAIEDGSATVDMLSDAVTRAAWFRKDYPEQLARLVSGDGTAKATGAYLLRDRNAEDAILSGADTEAQRTLLSEMRAFGGEPEDEWLEKVMESPDPVIAEAAADCLERRKRFRFVL